MWSVREGTEAEQEEIQEIRIKKKVFINKHNNVDNSVCIKKVNQFQELYLML